MNEDEVGQRLRDAFDARAREGLSDHAAPPAPRFASERRLGRRHRRVRLLAPLAAAAAVVAVGASVLAVQHASDNHGDRAVGGRTSASPVPTTTAPTRVSGTPVHIKVLNADGATYGIGMPVVALLSKKITSAKALQDATTATVDGKSIRGAWYFEHSSYHKGYPIEAHWRPQDYWPAHSNVHIDMPTRGLSAGSGLAYDDSLTLDFSIGARHVAVVNDATHRITVTSDGKTLGSYPVSLGAHDTPTTHGVKVIMEKGASICMSGPGYQECGVKYTQRLTYGGEYIHAAPWNTFNIDRGVDSSNGCTNMLTGDAQRLYKVFEVGDVVVYPNADGPTMRMGAGYGDWNVPWRIWVRGGLIPTS